MHSTNPIERLNGEIKRRTEVVGIFPDEAAMVRLDGTIPLGQSDEGAGQHARGMTLEAISTGSDTATIRLLAAPISYGGPTRRRSSRAESTRCETTSGTLRLKLGLSTKAGQDGCLGLGQDDPAKPARLRG